MAVHELLVRLGLDDSTFSKKIQGVNREIANLDKQYEALSSATIDFEKTQDGLQKKMEHLKDKMTMVSEKSELLINHKKLLNKEISELKDKYSGLQNSMSNTQKEIERVSQAMQDSSKNSDELRNKITKLEDMKETFAKSSKAVEEHSEALKKSQKVYSELAQRLEEVKAKNKEYQTVNNKLEAELKTQKATVSDLNKAYTNNQRAIQETEDKLKRLTEEFGNKNRRVTETKKKLESLKAEQESINTSLESARGKLKSLTNEYEANAIKLSKTKSEINALKTAMSTLNNDITVQKRVLAESQQAHSALVAELSKFGIQAKTTAGAIAQLEQEIQKEKRAIKENDEANSAHVKRLKELENQLKGEQQQLDKTTKAIQRKNAELQRLEGDISKSTTMMNKFNIELAQTEAKLKTLAIDQLSEKFTKLGDTFTNLGKVLTTVGTTLTASISAPLAMFGKQSVDTFTEFEKTMRKVNATFGGTGSSMEKQFKSLSNQTREFAKATEWTANQVGEAYQYLSMAGLSVEQSTNSMIPMLNLASIGMLDLGVATDIVSDTMTPFSKNLKEVGEKAKANGKDFNEAQYMVDIFSATITNANTNVELMGETLKYSASAVATSGASFEDLAIAIGIMGNSAIKGSQAGTSMATGLTRLITKTGEAGKAMEKYGLDIVTTNDGSLDLMATMESLREKTSQMTDVQKEAVAKQVFGQTAMKGWLPILNASTEEWNRMKDAVYNAEGATEKMMEQMRQSGSYAISIMKSNIDDLRIAIGDALAPVIKDISQKIANFTQKISDWVERMKATNPELLEFIGKMAVMAVVIPPVIAVLGLMSSAFGTVFGGIGKLLGGFSSLIGKNILLKAGVAESASGFTKFATVLTNPVVAIGAVTTAIIGLITWIGQSADALSYLQDTFGEFGRFIGEWCELISGAVTALFTYIWEPIKAIGKSLKAIVTGQFRDLDDIWSDAWNKMVAQSKESLSDLKQETSHALEIIKTKTKEEMNETSTFFSEALRELPKTTKDNLSEVAETMVSKVEGMSEESLTILRGTSDTMSILLSGIKEGMDTSEIQEKLNKNLNSLLQSGELTASKLEKDFSKANETIMKNVADSYNKASQEARKALNELGKISKNGVNEVSNDLAEIVGEMNNTTYKTLLQMGDNWSKVFQGISNTSDLSTAEMAEKINSNLKNLGADGVEGLTNLTQALQNELQNTATSVDYSLKQISESSQQITQTTATSVDSILTTLTTKTDDSMQQFAEKMVAGIQQLGAETANELRMSSDAWYAILDGAYNENGEMNADFIHTLIGNFNFLNLKTPEQVQEYCKTITEGFDTAKITATSSTEEAKNEVIQNAQEMVDGTVETGQKVVENLTPENLEAKVKEQMELAEQGLASKKESFAEEARKISEEAEQKFRSELENMSQIEIPDSILAVEKIESEMGLGGQIAVRAFAQSWSDNSQVLRDGIKATFSTLSSDMVEMFAPMVTAVEELATKVGILGDTATSSKDRLVELANVDYSPVATNMTVMSDALNASRESGENLGRVLNDIKDTTVNNLTSSINGTKEALVATAESANVTTTKLNTLKNINVSSLNNNLSQTGDKLKAVSDKAKTATDSTTKLTNVSFSSMLSILSNLESRFNNVKSAIERATQAVEKIVSTSFGTIFSNLDSLSNRFETVKNSAQNAKSKIQELNYISFSSLINSLNGVKNTLNSVASTADSTRNKISAVKNSQNAFSRIWGSITGDSSRSIGDSLMMARAIMPMQDFINDTFSTNAVDMSSYKTAGGYYSSSSMAGTGARSRRDDKDLINTITNAVEKIVDVKLNQYKNSTATQQGNGQMNLIIENFNNNRGIDIKSLVEEIEFYRRQANMKGVY